LWEVKSIIMKNIFTLTLLILPILAYCQDLSIRQDINMKIEYEKSSSERQHEKDLIEEEYSQKEQAAAAERTRQWRARMSQQLANQKMREQGWKEIKENRYTYTQVGNTGLARLKKLKEKALIAIKQESIKKEFDYEIIEIFEHKQSFGVLAKVEVLIKIIE
jgi:hypothetical protein